MDRALLTGVTGFVGSHLARDLLADGVDVHAIVRTTAALDRIPDIVSELELHVDDGSTGALAAAVESADPAATFHLATRFVGEHRADDIPGLVTDNVTFPTRLMEALATAGSRRVVNVGTAWQHVDGASYRPKNLYAATKQACEDVFRYYVEADRLDVTTVNLFDTYGPRDHRGKLIGALIAAVASGETLAMSSGRQLIDLVHVADVVDALRRAARLAPPAPGPYAVSSGAPCTLRHLVDLVGELVGRPVPIRWGARPDRDGEMLEPWYAGPPVPGGSDPVPLDAGLGALIASG